MKTPVFTGTATALATPFAPDGSINLKTYKAQIKYQLDCGTDALVAVGTTGENAVLSRDEHVKLMECAVEAAGGKVPVICSTGSNDTSYCIKTSMEAKKCGADALLLVTPYYNKTSQSGLIRHYFEILDAVGLPAILYHIPARTGLKVKPETFSELSRHPLVVGLKEASGDVSYCAEINAICGDDLPVYSGCDDLTVPIMSVGGKGVISVLSNILPTEAAKMTKLCLENDFEAAYMISKKYHKLTKLLFSDINPLPLKAAMKLLDRDSGICRPPLYSVDDGLYAKLREELINLKLINS